MADPFERQSGGVANSGAAPPPKGKKSTRWAAWGMGIVAVIFAVIVIGTVSSEISGRESERREDNRSAAQASTNRTPSSQQEGTSPRESAYIDTMADIAGDLASEFSGMERLSSNPRPGDADWDAEAERRADNIIALCRNMHAQSSPAARFDRAHGLFSQACHRYIESSTLFKQGIRNLDAGAISESTRLTREGSELMRQATAAIPN